MKRRHRSLALSLVTPADIGSTDLTCPRGAPIIWLMTLIVTLQSYKRALIATSICCVISPGSKVTSIRTAICQQPDPSTRFILNPDADLQVVALAKIQGDEVT
jgi:hypothetical protein